MTFERTAQAVVNYVQWALSCYALYLSSQCKKDGNKQEPNKHVDYNTSPILLHGSDSHASCMIV